MEFGVLGPIQVSRVPVTGVMRRTLLGLLLSRADQLVPTDLLAEALWPHDPGDTARRLQVQVSKLRRVLGEPQRLIYEQAGYRLQVSPHELDAALFTSLVDQSRRVLDAEPARCAELVRQALALWRGRPYEGAAGPLLAGAADALVERRLAAVELLFEAELRLGRHDEIVSELTALVAEHPLRERLHGLLMTALQRAGRHREALAVGQSVRAALQEELGLDPGPELRAIEERIVSDTPPAQLPHDVVGFVGRDAELSELDGLLASGESACVLAGTAGVGKTALAVRWAHRTRRRFADGQLYVNLRGYDPARPVSPEDALASFLRALGLDGAAIPPDLQGRADRFRNLVAGRQLLVVLDNAHSPEQVRPLIPGTAFAVVTSRDALTGLGARRIDLDQLPYDDAHRLLRDLIGDRLAAADVLIELCARLPLALRIAAELVNSRQRTGVAELVAELADHQRRLDLFDLDGDQHASVRGVLSWSYRHLPPDAARLFRLGGLHPGHAVDVTALAALAGRDVARSLDTLVHGNLVDRGDDGRLRSHDLLRAYSVELTHATDPEPDRHAALTRLRDHYLRVSAAAMNLVAPHEAARRPRVDVAADVPLVGHDDAMRWLDAERANLLAVATHGPPEYLVRMSAMLWRYLDMGSYYDEAMTLHTAALAAAPDDAAAHLYLGITLYRLCRLEEATEQLEQALRSEADRSVWAAALNNLGNVCCRAGDFAAATPFFEKALELYEQVGSLSQRGGVLGNLGAVHQELGNHGEARRYLEQASAVAEESGDRGSATSTLRDLGRMCLDTGDHDDALRYLRRGVPLARESGLRLFEAELLNLLGTVHCRLDEHEQALRHHDAALTLVRAVDDRPILADVLNGFAETCHAAGDPTTALRYHGEALAVAVDSGIRNEQARAYAGFGNAHHQLGDHEAAREHWHRAMTLYRELGLPQATELAATLD